MANPKQLLDRRKRVAPRAKLRYQQIDGTDDQDGRPVASGIYFVAMVAGSHVETLKIVLLK